MPAGIVLNNASSPSCGAAKEYEPQEQGSDTICKQAH